MDDEGGRGKRPFEFIEDGGEGIGDWDVVVDEQTVLVAAASGNAPAHELARAGQDLGLAGGILAIRFRRGDAITEAASVDNGKEAIS